MSLSVIDIERLVKELAKLFEGKSMKRYYNTNKLNNERIVEKYFKMLDIEEGGNFFESLKKMKNDGILDQYTYNIFQERNGESRVGLKE